MKFDISVQYYSELEWCWVLRQNPKTMWPPPAISEEAELHSAGNSAVFCQVTGAHLMCQIFMNDLFTEQGQQKSRVISGKLLTLLKGLHRIGTKFNL